MLAQFCSLLHGCGFGAPVGSNPGSIMQATDGNFYGVTFNGGNGGGGAVWQLVANTWALNMLFSFDSGPMGLYPGVTLVQGRDGQLYGVTHNGGSGNPDCASYCGTVFKVSLSGHETVLYSFCSQTNCTDGATPAAPLVQGGDGNFYGTTYAGGANGAGVIFKITPNGAYTVLHSFGGGDGGAALAPLIQGSDGNFYGSASVGGTHNDGTLFRITPSGTFAALYSFSGSDGANPEGAMVQDSQGNFYGTTLHGGANLAATAIFTQLSYSLTRIADRQRKRDQRRWKHQLSRDVYPLVPFQHGCDSHRESRPRVGAFGTWGQACSGDSPTCNVTMTGDESVSATFTQNSYTLTRLDQRARHCHQY